jgi:hypothetical protein
VTANATRCYPPHLWVFAAAVVAPIITTCPSATAQPCAAFAWTQRDVIGPGARAFHTMAYDSARGVTELFGGFNGVQLGDTWEWDGTTWTQRPVGGPPARLAPAMVYDSFRHVAVLFGGSYDVDLGDTWEWDGTAWVLRSTSGPPARARHAMAYDSVRHVTVLFGGGEGGGGFSDTWEWDGVAWVQRATGTPPGRYSNTMAFDAARGVTVLFGGYGTIDGQESVCFGDTWEWDGADWALRATTGPSARAYPTITYDTVRDRVVLFGGYTCDGTRLDDTWEWDGTQWTQIAASGPSARGWHAMAFDAARGRSVLFGGFGTAGVPLGDTWELAFNSPVMIETEPQSQSVRIGRPVDFTVSAAGAVPVMYQWRRNGVALVDGGRIVGSNAPTLTINYVGFSDAGDYDAVVTSGVCSATSDAATLTVYCPADWNRDGTVNSQDYFDFLSAFFAGAGDFNSDGITNSQDFFDFISAFFAGCP